jgi:integrase
VHRLLDHDDPTQAQSVKLAMRRMLRQRGRRQKQALSLVSDLREKLIVACGEDRRGLRDRALIAVGYDTLCRRSELVSLLAQDVDRSSDGSGSVLIRRSKTDQIGEGRFGYLSPVTMDRLIAWLEAVEVAKGPIFRAVHPRGIAQ